MTEGERYYTVVMQSWREWTFHVFAEREEDAIRRAEDMLSDGYGEAYLSDYDDAVAAKIDLIGEYEDGLTDVEPPEEAGEDPVPEFKASLAPTYIHWTMCKEIDDFFERDDPGTDMFFMLHGPYLGEGCWLDLYRHPRGGWEVSCRSRLDDELKNCLNGLLPPGIRSASALADHLEKCLMTVTRARTDRMLEELWQMLVSFPKYVVQKPNK